MPPPQAPSEGLSGEAAPTRGPRSPESAGPPSPFPRLLRACRERHGLSQNALARAAGLSPSMVNMLESGERHPTREIARRLAEALGLAPGETDELLVAAGQLPLAYDHVAPADPDLLLVARLLGDLTIPATERLQLRLLLRLLALRWRPGTLDVEQLAGAAPAADRPDGREEVTA